MTTAQARTAIKVSLETAASHAAAAVEGAALAGLLGYETQMIAMSQAYLDLRAAGRFEEARAMKLRAVALKAAYDAYEGAK